MPVTQHSPPACDLTQAEIARWRPIPTAIAADQVCEAGQIDPALALIGSAKRGTTVGAALVGL
jgi:hypothetical protein